MAQGLGDEITGEVFVDSSAALSITQRKGNGKMRHVKIGQLWIQEVAEEEELKFRKIGGDVNPADLGTKNLTRKKVDDLITKISLHDAEGRAEQSLRI